MGEFMKFENLCTDTEEENFENELFPRCNAICSNVEELKKTIRETLLKPIRFLRGANFGYVNIEKDNLADVVLIDGTQKNYAFLYAAFSSDTIVQLQGLYEQGANINFQYPGENFNALHLSALHGSIECIRWLLEHDCQIVNTSQGLSPLHFAAISNSLHICRFFFLNGCKVDTKALQIAVWTNAVECFEYFFAMWPPINEYDESGFTVLHLATYVNNLKILKSLLGGRHFDVNVKTKFRENTALHLAAENGYVDCAKILIQWGANVNALSANGQTPLHLACKENFLDCVQCLLEEGAAVNALDTEERTPLHAAVGGTLRNPSHNHIVRCLINRGADVQQADCFGYTALHLAAVNKLDECVEELILSGANVAAKTEHNVTALNIMNRRTPNTCSKIRETLDTYLAYNREELLKFNFRVINRNSTVGEVNYLYTLQKEGQAKALEHPISKAFLHLKWQKVRIFVILRLVFSVMTTLLLSSLISWGISDPEDYQRLLTLIGNRTNNQSSCDKQSPLQGAKKNSSEYSNIVDKILNENGCFANYIFIFIMTMLFVNALRIAFTLPAYKSFKHFFIVQYGNLVEILVTVCIPLNLINMHSTFIHIESIDKETLRRSLAGLTLMASWANLMITASQLPAVGAYVAVFKKVLIEFLKVNIAFLSLLMGFTATFCTVRADRFQNLSVGLTKVMAMMTGELNSEDLLKPDGGSMSIHVHITALVLSTFIVIITIVLMNLLVGIAVADVEGLRKEADLTTLIQQTKLIYFVEKCCSSGFFPPYMKAVLRKFLCVWPDSYTRVVMYVQPFSPNETRLPRDVIDAGMKIALKRLKNKNLENAGMKPSVEDRISSLEGNILKLQGLTCTLQETLVDVATKLNVSSNKNVVETTSEFEDVA